MRAIGAVNALYPMPTVLAGALVKGRPNFITIAHVGIVTMQHISLSMGKVHYTNPGIKEKQAFSVCLPSRDLLVQTDFCGIMSGKTTDKAALFDVFYGELKTAPMIRECPVCMECRVERVLDYPTNEVFIGEIVQTWASEAVLADGKIDLARLQPLLFDMSSKHYWGLGPVLGECWGVGKQLKQK